MYQHVSVIPDRTLISTESKEKRDLRLRAGESGRAGAEKGRGGENEATSKHSKVPHEMKGHAATGLLRAKSRKGRPDGHRDGRRENERSA